MFSPGWRMGLVGWLCARVVSHVMALARHTHNMFNIWFGCTCPTMYIIAGWYGPKFPLRCAGAR